MPPLDDDVRRGQAAGPLQAINSDAIYTANDWIAAVAGGSVGVMGTLIQLELKQVTCEAFCGNFVGIFSFLFPLRGCRRWVVLCFLHPHHTFGFLCSSRSGGTI